MTDDVADICAVCLTHAEHGTICRLPCDAAAAAIAAAAEGER